MADAAKSDEIEDVLSSIRRLVSEHQPPARSETAAPREPAQPPHAETGGDGPPDRLLLTPALRVTDPEDPWVPIVPRADEDAAAPTRTDDGLQAPEIARDDGADWARELWAEEAEAEETAPGDDPEHAPDPQLQADEWDAADHRGEAEEPRDEEDRLENPVDVTEDLLQNLSEQLTDEAEHPSDEAPVPDVPLSFIRSTKSVSDYEPDEDNVAMSGSDLPAPTLELAEARAAHADDRDGDRADDCADERHEEAPRVRVEILRTTLNSGPPAGAGTGTPPGSDQTQGQGDTPQPVAAASEGAQGMADAGNDADAGSSAPADPTDPAAASVAELWAEGQAEIPDPSPMPEPADDAVEDLGEAPFTFPDDSDGFVDEDALRAIIADVVREELQGELGVRITRNVRKLVRREIRLALAAQDIE